LHGGCALLGQGGRGAAEDQLDGFAGEGREPGDGEVFVVEVGVIAEDLVGLEAITKLVSALPSVETAWFPCEYVFRDRAPCADRGAVAAQALDNVDIAQAAKRAQNAKVDQAAYLLDHW
jgi:hypothetical protein